MKAVMLTGAGGTEMLKLREVPAPVIKDPLDVMVSLHAGGLNPTDYKLHRKGGYYPDHLPVILGGNEAGVARAIGEAVTKFKIGDEGTGYVDGGLAKRPERPRPGHHRSASLQI